MPDPVRIIPIRHNEGEAMGLKESAAEFFAREKVRRAGRVLLVIAVLAVFLAAVGLSAYAILAYAPLKLTIDLGAETSARRNRPSGASGRPRRGYISAWASRATSSRRRRRSTSCTATTDLGSGYSATT